jgi:hypothetical protein
MTTREGVLASVEADSRLESKKERCWVYRELAARWRGVTRDEYPKMGREGCADYPFDQFPWK